MDPDPYSAVRLDPEPNKTNTDPKHCYSKINVRAIEHIQQRECTKYISFSCQKCRRAGVAKFSVIHYNK